MRSGSRRSAASIATFQKKQLCLVIAALLAPPLSLAAPVIGSGGVTSGQATIVQAGAVTNINQSTNKASINWQSFSTKPTETINFNQPGTSSITLNRVIGNEKSVLEGALNATGQVFLVNSSGVLFAKGSTVNTGGFVASTLNLTDADFNAGNYVFKASGGSGSVINLGTITAKDGGYVALLGNTVSNQGVISATRGTVAMNAGDKITLNFNGDSLLSVTLDEGTLNALVTTRATFGKTGTWLLDPDSYTIGVGGDMTGAALTTQCARGSTQSALVRLRTFRRSRPDWLEGDSARLVELVSCRVCSAAGCTA